MSINGNQAGWYPDPWGVAPLRWFDGQQWTAQVSAGAESKRSEPTPASRAREFASRARASLSTSAASLRGRPRQVGQDLRTAFPAPTSDVRSPIPRPAARLIRSPDDAEEAAAEWMRWFGFEDARRTPTGPDRGLDVISRGAVAQVKDHGTAIGRPLLQQLHGAGLGRRTLFFSRQGFTTAAVEWADGVGMALFRFDLQGEPEPQNPLARQLFATRPAQLALVGQRQALCFPTRLSDVAALTVLERHCEGRGAGRERLVGAWHVWLPLYGMRYRFSEPTGRVGTVREHYSDVVLDGLTLRPYPVALNVQSAVTMPASEPLPPIKTADALVSYIHDLWNTLIARKQQAARARLAEQLRACGVPVDRANALHAEVVCVLQRPLFVGVYDHLSGRRLAAVDGEAGAILTPLGMKMTQDSTGTISILDARGRRLSAPSSVSSV